MRKTFFSHAFIALFLKKNADVDGRSAGLRGAIIFPCRMVFALPINFSFGLISKSALANE